MRKEWNEKDWNMGNVHLVRRVSLVEYFCTQGLLTLVAGESHPQACFGPCCMSVFEVNDDEE
jgi:hypothetical protein